MKTFSRRKKAVENNENDGIHEKKHVVTLFELPVQRKEGPAEKEPLPPPSAWASRSLNYRRSSIPLSALASKGLKDLQDIANDLNRPVPTTGNASPPGKRGAGGAAKAAAPRGAAAGPRGGRWERDAAKNRDVEMRVRHMAEMRAFFEEVDEFDLAVESPNPGPGAGFGRRGPAPGPGPLPAVNAAFAATPGLDASMMSTGGKTAAEAELDMAASPAAAYGAEADHMGSTPAAAGAASSPAAVRHTATHPAAASAAFMMISPVDMEIGNATPAGVAGANGTSTGGGDASTPSSSAPSSLPDAPVEDDPAAGGLQDNAGGEHTSTARRGSSVAFPGLSRRSSVLIHPSAPPPQFLLATPGDGGSRPSLGGAIPPADLGANAPHRLSMLPPPPRFSLAPNAGRPSMLPPPPPPAFHQAAAAAASADPAAAAPAAQQAEDGGADVSVREELRNVGQGQGWQPRRTLGRLSLMPAPAGRPSAAADLPQPRPSLAPSDPRPSLGAAAQGLRPYRPSLAPAAEGPSYSHNEASGRASMSDRASLAPPQASLVPPPRFSDAHTRLSMNPPPEASAAVAFPSQEQPRLSFMPAPPPRFSMQAEGAAMPPPRFSMAPPPAPSRPSAAHDLHVPLSDRASLGIPGAPRPSLAPPPAATATQTLEDAPMEQLGAAAEQLTISEPTMDSSIGFMAGVGHSAAAEGPETPLEACLPEQLQASQAGHALTPLQELAAACGQTTDLAGLPTMDDLMASVVDMTKVRKIGEGTFGEAFREGSHVIKIVPVDGDTLVNGEKQKSADELLAEVVVTRRLSGLRAACPDEGSATNNNVTEGFVQAHMIGLCRGRYSSTLIREWHRWDQERKSENDPVDIFGPDQVYTCFVLSDGGTDLEHFEMRGYDEVRGMLMQVALTLSVAEEACEFEHRDLHWGNVLLRRCPGRDRGRCLLRGIPVEFSTGGVEVTVIDFTLSRLVASDGTVAFCDLEADPELFKGPRGNCQADTYRRMRKATKGRWAGHCPETNCLWMHYLADCVLGEKQVSLAPSEKHDLKGFRKRALGYRTCSELLWDELFTDLWASVQQQ